MEAPKCRICGERHWSRLCPVTENVTKPVTKPVTLPDPVTKIVTPRQADLETDNKRLVSRVAELETEVKELKRALATQAPMSAAERQRASRAKRAQK